MMSNDEGILAFLALNNWNSIPNFLVITHIASFNTSILLIVTRPALIKFFIEEEARLAFSAFMGFRGIRLESLAVVGKNISTTVFGVDISCMRKNLFMAVFSTG